MKSWTKGVLSAGLLACGLVSAGGIALAADEPANIIKYRKATMSAIGGHMGMLAAVAKGEVSFIDEVGGNAHAINEMSKNLARLFPEGTSNQGNDTRALPVIWEKWSEFEGAVKTLQDESAKLVEVAKSGDAAAIGAQVGALGKNACGGCHKKFREEKK